MIYKEPPSPIINYQKEAAQNDIDKYLLSDGADCYLSGQLSLPVKYCLITIKGRISGQWRRMPIVYTMYNNNLYIAASKGGASVQPDWYLNAIANPIVWVQAELEEYWGVCKQLDPIDDKDLRNIIWKRLNYVFPQFDLFQAKCSDRIIPVIQIKRL